RTAILGQSHGCPPEKDPGGLRPLSSGDPRRKTYNAEGIGMNDWKAGCIERCTSSLVGGRWKRTDCTSPAAYPTKVFVLSQGGIPLMPTTPRRARLWLKARRAKVVRHDPFTIQLCFETASHTQLVILGVDTGSQRVGIAATSSGSVLFQAE